MSCCTPLFESKSKNERSQPRSAGEALATAGPATSHSAARSLSNIPQPASDGPMGPEGNWRMIPELTDTFTGNELDDSKWMGKNPTWRGRAPGWFNEKNVEVKEGCLELWSRVEEAPREYGDKYHSFSTAFVRSKKMMGYGFVQVVVQVADSVTSSAFWLVHNRRTVWNEIDVFEASNAKGQRGKYHMNMHVFRMGGQNLENRLHKPKTVNVGFDLTEGPFVAGLERTREVVRWYVNGRVVREVKNDHWHEEMWVQFDCETMGNWFGVPSKDDEKLPAVFKVFEVRAWTRD